MALPPRIVKIVSILTGIACVIGAIVVYNVFFSKPAIAQMPAKLEINSGDVKVKEKGQSDWIEASNGMALKSGDSVRTGADGRATIVFFEGSVSRIDHNSELMVEQTGQPESDTQGRDISLSVIVGKTWHRVQKLVGRESRFEVKSPTAVATVRGTVFRVDVDEQGEMVVYVVEGSVDINPEQGEIVTLSHGDKVIVAPGVVLTPELIEKITSGDKDDFFIWNTGEDKTLTVEEQGEPATEEEPVTDPGTTGTTPVITETTDPGTGGSDTGGVTEETIPTDPAPTPPPPPPPPGPTINHFTLAVGSPAGTIHTKNVNVTGTVSDGSVASVLITVNGTLVEAAAPVGLIGAYDHAATLVEGSNTISVEATNSEGHTETTTVFVTVQFDYKTVYVDCASVSSIEDGTVANPFKTITAAEDFAIWGDTINVAPGTYTDAPGGNGEVFPLEMKPVLLKGTNGAGLTTIEYTKDSGDPSSQALILSGGPDQGLSGFTVRALHGTGIDVVVGSFLQIDNCIVESCETPGIVFGGGGASGGIVRNNIIRNNGGPAITLMNGSSVQIGNNLIVGNSSAGGMSWPAAGISISDSTGQSGTVNIFNNTIYGNIGGNGRGVGYEGAGTSEITVTNCIVWGNTDDLLGVNATYTCTGDMGDAGIGNIHTDPMFVDFTGEDYHLAAGSPCIDSGEPNDVTDDLDGEVRPLDGDKDGNAIVDMGCYEYVPPPVTVYVDGSNILGPWEGTVESPYQSITAGLAGALSGKTVIVAAGTYSSATTGETFPISLKSGVVLQGAGASTTTIQGNGVSSVVQASDGVTTAAKIDGFTITEGKASYGGGIYCGSSFLTISNNTITGNSASLDGAGIYCSYSNPAISNNTITGNIATIDGGGINCYYSSPSISGNDISDNTAAYYGGGISCESASPTILSNNIKRNVTTTYGGGIACNASSAPDISSNDISGNNGTWYGGGVYSQSSSPTVSNNIITANTSIYGGGMYCSASSPTISNDTITGNTATSSGGGIFCETSTPTVFNCIVWGNALGDLYGCSAAYSCIGVGTLGPNSISANPLFVNAGAGEYQLQPGSPCIDTGIDVYNGFAAPLLDLYGTDRPSGAGYDMGYFEYAP